MDDHGNFWEFAAKAGHNAEHHNHNDCGSFILDINGTEVISEIGAPEYTRDYFRENRYRYLAARTIGHSLPVINGCEQAAGPQYVSRTVSCELGGEHVDFIVDITACYPEVAGCVDVTRSFSLDKRAGILLVKEYFDLTRRDNYETALITTQPAILKDDGAVIMAGILSVLVKPEPGTVLRRIEEQGYRGHDGTAQRVNRIVLRPENLATAASVACQITIEGASQ
jgi:hypothetical protein